MPISRWIYVLTYKDWSLKSLVHNRLHVMNQNWLCCIIGGTGTGKSYTSLTFAKLIDPDFTLSRVVFTVDEFFEVLNDKSLKKGSVIIFDEAGVGIPAREWQQMSNKAVGYVLQTFRHKNLAVIFTVPSFRYIDIQARMLFHNIIKMVYINRQYNNAVAKIYFIENNELKGDYYIKKPRLDAVRGRQRIDYVYIKPPPKELTEAYEARRVQYTSKLNKKLQKDLKGKKPKPDFEDYVKLAKKNLDQYCRNSRWGKKVFQRALFCAKTGAGELTGKRVAEILIDEGLVLEAKG